MEEGFPPNSPSAPSAVGKAEKVEGGGVWTWRVGHAGETLPSWTFVTRLASPCSSNNHRLPTPSLSPKRLRSLSPGGRQEVDVINRKWKSMSP